MFLIKTMWHVFESQTLCDELNLGAWNEVDDIIKSCGGTIYHISSFRRQRGPNISLICYLNFKLGHAKKANNFNREHMN